MDGGENIKSYDLKNYLHNFEKKEDWTRMIQFLDAAYDFTKARIF